MDRHLLELHLSLRNKKSLLLPFHQFKYLDKCANMQRMQTSLSDLDFLTCSVL